jgi:pimeloyl-ACP methyl ester carboxylesterase
MLCRKKEAIVRWLICLTFSFLSFSCLAKQQHVVILRGLIRENGHSQTLYNYHAQLKPNFIIHGLELHGNGQYFKMQSALSVSEMVEQVRADYLKIKQNYSNEDEFTLAAISLGGMIAAEWMSKYPQDFKRLVLVNTSFKGICTTFERFRPDNFKSYIKLLFANTPVEKEEILFEFILFQKEKNRYLINHWAQIRQERPVSNLNTLRQLLAGWSFSLPINPPNIPTWIMVGEKDQLVSPNCSHQIAKRWNVPLLQSFEAGHDLTNDDPKWLIDEINKILKIN